MDKKGNGLDLLRHAVNKHKGPQARKLQLLRSNIGTALDALLATDDEGKQPTKEDVAKACEALRDMDGIVRTMQMDVSKGAKMAMRLSTGNAEVHSETKSWLVSVFTDIASEAARSHHQILSSSRTRHQTAFVPLARTASKILSVNSVQQMLQSVGTPEFDAFAFIKDEHVTGNGVLAMGEYLIQRNNLPSMVQSQGSLLEGESHQRFNTALKNFFTNIDKHYKPDVIYHGVAHAVDVASGVQGMLSTRFMIAKTTDLDHLMAIVAALIHDVGHPGKNAAYLMKIMDPLAIRYNDHSILENMHLALSFDIMQSDQNSDWFGMLEGTTREYVRRGLIDMVLGTDMSKHADHVKNVTHFAEEHDAAHEEGEHGQEDEHGLLETKLFLLRTVLHASDISNPCRPRAIMLAWTQKVCQEFWAQGDVEKTQGLPISPMCDRNGNVGGMNTIAAGQLGFTRFIVKPFFWPLAALMPELKGPCESIVENTEFWTAKQEENATYEQLFG
eukprot:TRINITY_DN7025_c0_g1_i1.p1 TRINITY_DN7025_c0_g1~~TRINITY_DN7025_c0_g1_i1.p1  ORF type:complete len:501 (-),score=80.44 TRINITY_DN7025_c0_g1_i1:70-1572(-)